MTAQCECGCGEPAPIAQRTSNAAGHVRGKPVRFLPGHHSRTDVNERFDSKWTPEPNTGCHLWTAGTDMHGYAQFRVNGKGLGGHRFAWVRAHGPVPDGLHLDHLCRVRCCVNPAHLEPVTVRENIMRSPLRGTQKMGITQCPRGHSYDDANTYRRPDGGRGCRKCIAEHNRRRALQRKGLGA
jgi:hypothetical protein